MNLPIWKYLPKFVAPLEKGIAEDFSGIVESAGKDSGYEVGDEVGLNFPRWSSALSCTMLHKA